MTKDDEGEGERPAGAQDYGQGGSGPGPGVPEDFSMRRFGQHGGQSGEHWHSASAPSFNSMGGTAQDRPERYGDGFGAGMDQQSRGQQPQAPAQAPEAGGAPDQVYEENRDNWRDRQMLGGQDAEKDTGGRD